jgi:predicted MFS family arabinose efflux permease
MLTAESKDNPAPSVNKIRFPYALVLWSSAVFALQIGIARLGYGLALPAIRSTLHGDYTLYGTINTASLAGYLAGALIAPLLIRRMRQLVFWSSVVAAGALAISAFSPDAFIFGLTRTAFGIASGVSLVAAAVQTLEAVDTRRRGGASAVMWGGIGIGLAVSAMGAGWVVQGALDWRIASFVTGALTALAGIGYGVAARHVASTPPQDASEKQPLRLRSFGFLCVSYFLFGFAYIAYATFIVAAIDARTGVRSANTTVEVFWALYGVASVVGTAAIGRILAHPIGRAAMAFSGLASATGCAAAILSAHALLPSAILVGLGLTATPTAATAFARARSTAASAPVAIAIVTVAVGAGQLVGPTIAGAAADRFGPASVAVVACGIYLLQALCAAIDAITWKTYPS